MSNNSTRKRGNFFRSIAHAMNFPFRESKDKFSMAALFKLVLLLSTLGVCRYFSVCW